MRTQNPSEVGPPTDQPGGVLRPASESHIQRWLLRVGSVATRVENGRQGTGVRAEEKGMRPIPASAPNLSSMSADKPTPGVQGNIRDEAVRIAGDQLV